MDIWLSQDRKTHPSFLDAMNIGKPYRVEDVLYMAGSLGLHPPEWKWKELRPYNGFSHEERVSGWQASKLAVQMQLIPPAETLCCEVCGVVKPIRLFYHSEDYSLLAQHVVCYACHMKIHQGQILLRPNE
jgi:hypothetical protein